MNTDELPHDPEALTGRRVRIRRNGHSHTGTVRAALPCEGYPQELSLRLVLDDSPSRRTVRFWLPPAAVVEAIQ